MREFLLGMNNFSGDERVDKCRFAFMLYDEDKNGFLTMEELVQVLKATHMATKAQQVMKKAQTIMKQCDRDGDGHIDPEEFVRCWVGTLWGNRLCLWWFFFGWLTFCFLFVLFRKLLRKSFPIYCFPITAKRSETHSILWLRLRSWVFTVWRNREKCTQREILKLF